MKRGVVFSVAVISFFTVLFTVMPARSADISAGHKAVVSNNEAVFTFPIHTSTKNI
jgi:hypothetical protein